MLITLFKSRQYLGKASVDARLKDYIVSCSQRSVNKSLRFVKKIILCATLKKIIFYTFKKGFSYVTTNLL
ncbi:hypothetical protein [Clostridium sp. 'deep sea']|uniref:hypothetical protein n=1 Tax=Clostridium sp. 'deep sea' TaxID=2779445 RepID=UPI001A9AFDC5|nr:hypothetical protein [Clostridium sp. 'deep sea']